jgi:hypothetical protein
VSFHLCVIVSPGWDGWGGALVSEQGQLLGGGRRRG